MMITDREAALIEAMCGSDRSLCPYHIKSVTGKLLEGGYGPGTCAFGDCASPDVAEPLCITGGPNALTEHVDLLEAYADAVIEFQERWS